MPHHLTPTRAAHGSVEQRCSYRHPDLHDEDVPEDADADGDGASTSTSSTQSFSILLVGDQNAGKSTFLHSFSKSDDINFIRLQSLLPCLTATFCNRCFLDRPPPTDNDGAAARASAPPPSDDKAVRSSMSASHDGVSSSPAPSPLPCCDELPYLDTDLGYAALTLTAENFIFFCDEFGISLGVGGQRRRLLSPNTRFVVLELHEVGGDHLDRLVRMRRGGASSSSASTSPEEALLDETLVHTVHVLSRVRHVAYFVNARTLDENLLEERVAFLEGTCVRAGRVSFFCSRIDDDGGDDDEKAGGGSGNERWGSTQQVKGHRAEGGHGAQVGGTDKRGDDAPDGSVKSINADADAGPFADVAASDPFAGVSTEGLEDEFGPEEWYRERSALLTLQRKPPFRACAAAVGRLFQQRRRRFQNAGVYPTRNLTEKGDLAVSGVLLTLCRLLVAALEGGADAVVRGGGSGNDHGATATSSAPPSISTTLPPDGCALAEAVELCLECARWRRAGGGRRDRTAVEDGAAAVVTRDDWDDFVDGRVTRSPVGVAGLFDRAMLALESRGVCHRSILAVFPDGGRYDIAGRGGPPGTSWWMFPLHGGMFDLVTSEAVSRVIASDVEDEVRPQGDGTRSRETGRRAPSVGSDEPLRVNVRAGDPAYGENGLLRSASLRDSIAFHRRGIVQALPSNPRLLGDVRTIDLLLGCRTFDLLLLPDVLAALQKRLNEP